MPIHNTSEPYRDVAEPGDLRYTVLVTIRLSLWEANPWELAKRLQDAKFEMYRKNTVHFADFVGFEIEDVSEEIPF